MEAKSNAQHRHLLRIIVWYLHDAKEKAALFNDYFVTQSRVKPGSYDEISISISISKRNL
jgi:phosphopantetheinyl transferase